MIADTMLAQRMDAVLDAAQRKKLWQLAIPDLAGFTGVRATFSSRSLEK